MIRNRSIDKVVMGVAGGVGFLGSLSANFIWDYIIPEAKLWVGLISLGGFLILFWSLLRGYGIITKE